MFKKSDLFIMFGICLFLGIFVASQIYAGGEYKKVITPENNEVLAVEVGKLTKTNSDLRQEVAKLTADLDAYRNSSESRKNLYDQYSKDLERFNIITGLSSKSGQGVVITAGGPLTASEIVDLVNAIKNIGASIIEINGVRLTISSSLSPFANQQSYEIKVLGNSKILKSALERKGGIVEQISANGTKLAVAENDIINIGSGAVLNYKYAKILTD